MVSTCETNVGEQECGRTWVTGGRVLHLRGVIQKISIEGSELFDGTGVLDINFNANMANWKGNLSGSLVYNSRVKIRERTCCVPAGQRPCCGQTTSKTRG